MARVTIEDCIRKIPNRFDLVLLATQRALEISSGAPPTVPRDNDKNHVIALREIAEGTVDPEVLRVSLERALLRSEIGVSAREDDAAQAPDADEPTTDISEEQAIAAARALQEQGDDALSGLGVDIAGTSGLANKDDAAPDSAAPA